MAGGGDPLIVQDGAAASMRAGEAKKVCPSNRYLLNNEYERMNDRTIE